MAKLADLKNDFTRLIKRGNLTHGYLFFGENIKDNFDFAKQLANFLENGKWESPTVTLFDTMVMDGGIDDARDGVAFLWKKPIKSSYKTLIILGDQRLTDQAQNAILKISEDPTAHALIILLVKNCEMLLPTVSSRFQKIFISSPFYVGEYTSSKEAAEMVGEFIKSDATKRKQLIKELLSFEDDVLLNNFVAEMLIVLRHDLIKNWRMIAELSRRWSLMSQYGTNKRIQLEAALLNKY
ncbi:MAG: hypothetical protein Q8Q37_00260 [bacterium]|nr:hypothetical protein [bacterium]